MHLPIPISSSLIIFINLLKPFSLSTRGLITGVIRTAFSAQGPVTTHYRGSPLLLARRSCEHPWLRNSPDITHSAKCIPCPPNVFSSHSTQLTVLFTFSPPVFFSFAHPAYQQWPYTFSSWSWKPMLRAQKESLNSAGLSLRTPLLSDLLFLLVLSTISKTTFFPVCCLCAVLIIIF